MWDTPPKIDYILDVQWIFLSVLFKVYAVGDKNLLLLRTRIPLLVDEGVYILMLAYEANIKIQQGWFLLEALGKNLSLVSSSS